MILYNCTDSRVHDSHKGRNLNSCCSCTAYCNDDRKCFDVFNCRNDDRTCPVIFFCSCIYASDGCKCADDRLCGTAGDDHFERTADCCCSGTFSTDCKSIKCCIGCGIQIYFFAASDICSVVDSRKGLIIQIDHHTGRCNRCCFGTGC